MRRTATAEQPLRRKNAEAFEDVRRTEETRNELLITRVLLVFFGVVLLVHTASRVFAVLPFESPASLLAWAAAAFGLRLALLAYLRRGPSYHPARKFVISTLDLAVPTIGSLLLAARGGYAVPFLRVVSVCLFAMLVVVSGLRYSTNVVVYTGAVAVVLHVALVCVTRVDEYRFVLLAMGIVILSVVTTCTAYNAASMLRIHREATLKEHLSRFLPPELVEHIAKQPDLIRRQTERRTATVLFADIRGFTRLSETLAPERVVAFLNEFLEEMTAAIMDHQGMLDKYIGDAVMGVFGVPFVVEDHALRALRAAMDMRTRLKSLNADLKRNGLPELSVGIGLHTGNLLIGAIGSSRRLDYTVIGDTVNVASRIEGMTRSYPVEILLSDSTRDAARGAVPLYEIATVQVKNRVQPLTLWSPDPLREEPDGSAGNERVLCEATA